MGTPRAGLYPLDRTEMPAARGGRRLRGRQRQERPSRCSGGPGPRPAQPISAPRGVSGLRGPCSLDKTPRAPGSPHVLPTPRSPPGLGGMSGPLRGASRPHTGAFGQGGAGVGGQGHLSAGGQLRDSGRGLGGWQRRPASHIRRAPRLPGKRSRQFTARPGVFIPNGGGRGAWGFPSTSHVQGRHPPPAPGSYFGSGEDAVAGPCLSCDRHTGHSEGKTENLGAEGVQGSGAVGVTQIPCACGRACCHPPQA